MAPTQRDQKFQIRVTDEERRMLEALAERDGLSASDVVRQLIRREYAATFGEAPKAKPKRR
jgi:DNA-binding GntR family transcriptional regulator